MNKNLFAITINQNHELYDQDIKLVQANLTMKTTSNYILLVKHGLTKTEHYHALIQTMYSFNDLKRKKIFHIEPLRNPEAYKKYMINHDVIEKSENGELEFHEQDKLLDYCILHGPTATVQKFGMLALKYYKSLKEYYNDYQVNIEYLKYLNSFIDHTTKGENE